MVEVEEPNSIIFTSFLTNAYDIQFGFYRVTPHSTVITEGEDIIQHKHLEEIHPLDKIESSPNPVKVKFIAREPGVYKILWSNSHSWFKAKTLLYRVIVLSPMTNKTQ
jgi:hypothetical protein